MRCRQRKDEAAESKVRLQINADVHSTLDGLCVVKKRQKSKY